MRLDTNKDFTKFQTGDLIGTITVSETKDTLEKNNEELQNFRSPILDNCWNIHL